MQTFATYAETRTLGAPIVRLFRVALRRDPDPACLADFVERLRQGAELGELAKDLVDTVEFRRLHGPGDTADAAFATRLCAGVLGEATGSARAAAHPARRCLGCLAGGTRRRGR